MSRINYDLKTIRAVVFDIDGVLSPLTIPVDSQGHPYRMTNLRDGLAMNRASKTGLYMAVISGARPSGIEKRISDLGVKDVFMHVGDKLTLLKNWMEEKGLTPEEVAYAGDDLPDIEPMKYCGLRVAPLDADEEIKAIANYISPLRGGEGVARDLIEQILRSKGLWIGPGQVL